MCQNEGMRVALKKPRYLFFMVLLLLFVIPSFLIVRAQEDLKWNSFHQTNWSLGSVGTTSLCVVGGSITGEIMGIPCDGIEVSSDKSKPPRPVVLKGGQDVGVVGMLASMNGSFYDNKPLSSMAYVASVGKEFGITPTYAQVSGSGSRIIEPVMILWQVLRNFTYLMFIIVFIAIGFMIMFRQKMNAQTVISIQAALPSLVIGLILVTFSYFIAALLVDSAFLGIQIVVQIFASVINPETKAVMNAFGNRDQLVAMAESSNLLNMLWNASTTTGGNIGDLFNTLSNTQSSLDITGNASAIGGSLTTGVVGAIIAGLMFFTINPVGLAAVLGGGLAIGTFIVPLASIVLTLVLIIALIIQFMKLFMKLLRSYITILVYTALGPLFILMGTLPGNGAQITSWWKTILANSLVFPAVFAGFLFSGMVLASGQWSATPPLFGGLSTDFIRLIVAYGFMLGLPAIPDMVKSAMGVKEITGIPEMAQAGFSTAYGLTRGASMKGVKQTEPYRQYQIGQKYRETRLNRDAQLDRNDEAARIERRRVAAANAGGIGGRIQRLYNAAFFKNMPGNEMDIMSNERRADGTQMTFAEAEQWRENRAQAEQDRINQAQAQAIAQAIANQGGGNPPAGGGNPPVGGGNPPGGNPPPNP